MENSHEANDGIGCPRAQEEEENRYGNLGDLDLSRLLLVTSRERLDAHLLCLLLHGLLVLPDVSQDLGVEEDEQAHWDDVGPGENGQHEHLGILSRSQVVEGAGGEVAFGDELVPDLERWHQREGQSPQPHAEDKDDSSLHGETAIHGEGNAPVSNRKMFEVLDFLFSCSFEGLYRALYLRLKRCKPVSVVGNGDVVHCSAHASKSSQQSKKSAASLTEDLSLVK